jgi:integrative and conjugative element protein (TIGR02256 family)
MLSVTLTVSAAESLGSHARQSTDGSETGGILLGHDRSADLLVTVAGDPGPAAIRTPNRFKRDLAHAQSLADDAYDRDGSVWIGEWHTHPNGPVQPSEVDLRTYFSHLSDPSLGFDRFLSLIALPCAEHGWEHVNVAAWVVHDNVAEAASIRTEGTDA